MMKSTISLVGLFLYSSSLNGVSSQSSFECNSQDVVFAIDESGSIDAADEWPAELNFVGQLLNAIDPDSNVGILAFDTDARGIHQLNDNQDRSTLTSIVNSIIQGRQWTNYEDAIALGISMFPSGNNLFPDIFVLVTDGQPNTPDDNPCGIGNPRNGYSSSAIDYKALLDAANIVPIIVGVGSSFDPNSPKVTCLVDDVTTQIVHIPTFTQEALDEQVDFIVNLICGCDLGFTECDEVTCMACTGDYFQPSMNNIYECANCQDTFGSACLSCSDYFGCTSCDTGFELVFSELCELYGCEEETCGDACPNGAYDSSLDIDEAGCPIACESSPCSCDELCFCADDQCKVNGCNQCQDGYFKKDYNHPCINCYEMYGSACNFCQDFNGCGECASGYTRVYDTDCELWKCQ